MRAGGCSVSVYSGTYITSGINSKARPRCYDSGSVDPVSVRRIVREKVNKVVICKQIRQGYK